MSAPSRNRGGETLGADEPSVSLPLPVEIDGAEDEASEVTRSEDDSASSVVVGFGSLDCAPSSDEVSVFGCAGGAELGGLGALVADGDTPGLTSLDVVAGVTALVVGLGLVWSGAEFAPHAQLTSPSQRKPGQERSRMPRWAIVIMIHVTCIPIAF
jgi:hypothetical protein